MGLKNTFPRFYNAADLYDSSYSIQYVEKKDLSESQISSSLCISCDGKGSVMVVLDEKQENTLVYYEEIPKPIYCPLLSDLSKEIQ